MNLYAKMNLIKAFRSYLDKMITVAEPGYKIMLMDKETIAVISIIIGMSEIMKHEVYMFERLDQMSSGENMPYLKCLVFIRPSSENIALLCRELQRPRYGSYYIFLSNVISKSDVKLLAEADEHEVVREIQEIYLDFLILSPHYFSLNMINPVHGLKWEQENLQRTIQGLTGVLFSLQLIPAIRYQGNSILTQQLASAVKQSMMTEASLYESGTSELSSLLLILDRREDAVTPLLHQWTYEAMVYELLNVSNGRVNLSHVQGISEELKEVVMTPTQDDFYAKNIYVNFGDISQTIKELMEEYQSKLSKQQKLESISDLKHFVENYPQFKKISGTVSKHVTVLGELSRLVGAHGLLELSECEQELVCGSDHSPILQRIRTLITSHKVREIDAIKLVTLYALRHENHPNNDIRGLVNTLRSRNVAECYLRGLKGVENVYTQHKPYLLEILDDAVRGRLKESSYPILSSTSSLQQRPSAVVVFIVGGTTYEESLAVHEFNTKNPNVQVILGGSSCLSSSSFLSQVEAAMDGVPMRGLRI